MQKILYALLITLFSFPVNAELDKYQQKALKQTQDLLKDPSQRMKAVNSSTKAKTAHQNAMDLLGSQSNVNKAYSMAAQMLEVIAKEANGDPQKMKQILMNGKSNPSALTERMPAEFKTMLKEIAGDIEGRSTPARQ